MWSQFIFTSAFASVFVFRYLRTVVSIFTFLFFGPYPIAENPKYVAADVTICVPTTLKSPAELLKCLRRISMCNPAHIFVVTANANIHLVEEICAANAIEEVSVLGVQELNKRHQMLKALEEVKTDITVFADDDVFWPDNFLTHLLAIFEDPAVGASGTRQCVRRNASVNVWNFLGIAYLERRVWNNIATNAIDGSISTLSGRTAAYRTEILKNEEFAYYFINDQWFGRPLNTDDDKCLTRYVYSHGWKIAIQVSTVIETSLEDNAKYLEQCKRWARAHWSGNFTVMTNESYWRSWRYAWGTYVIYVGQFQTPALLVEGVLFGLLYMALQNSSPAVRTKYFISYAIWIFFTKNLKMIPHYVRHPSDTRYIPISIAFSYVHGYYNILALCTLTNTLWGSQQLAELEKPKAETDAKVMPFLHASNPQAIDQELNPARDVGGVGPAI